MADRPVTFLLRRFGPSTGRYDLDGLFARGPIIEQEYGVFVIEAIRVRGCEAVTRHAHQRTAHPSVHAPISTVR